MLASTAMEAMKDTGTNVLNAEEDRYGGVIVYLDKPMDPTVFAFLLQSSMSNWRDEGKKGVWIKFSREHVKLVEVAMKAGFRYHHAEADYLMFVHWIPDTADTHPANASHRIGIGPFVINDKSKGNTINHCAVPRPHILASTAMEAMKDTGTNVLNAEEDRYGGVTVYLDKPMDPTVLASLLQSSMSNWRELGKKRVWIKVPKEHLNLLNAVPNAGFEFDEVQSDYLMLVHRIPNTAENASHRVGIEAFVINDKKEVLGVQERYGWFKSTGVFKLPTGTVGVGENISAAAIREVKEQTGIDTKFVEVLAFRQNHKSFFQKSDVLFVCMLQAHSFDIQTQTSEMPAAKWMAVEDYAAQPFVQLTSSLDSVAKICLEKLGGNYTGLTPLPSLACNCKGYDCETFMDYLGCSS